MNHAKTLFSLLFVIAVVSLSMLGGGMRVLADTSAPQPIYLYCADGTLADSNGFCPPILNPDQPPSQVIPGHHWVPNIINGRTLWVSIPD